MIYQLEFREFDGGLYNVIERSFKDDRSAKIWQTAMMNTPYDKERCGSTTLVEVAEYVHGEHQQIIRDNIRTKVAKV